MNKLKSFLLLALLLMSGPIFSDEIKTIDSFKLVDLKLNTFTFPADLKTDLMVVNFFASWCTSCEEEVPLLKKLSTQNQNVTFWGINAGESEKKASRFVTRADYPWKVLLDPDKVIAKKLNVLGIPTTLVINKQGQILFRGSRPPEDLKFK